MMRKFIVGFLAVLAVLYASPSNANVTTDIFSTFNCCGGSGTPYSGFVGSLSTSGVTFGTDTG